jgi:hypothetical protein
MATFKVQHRGDIYYEIEVEAETMEDAVKIADASPKSQWVHSDGPYFVDFYEVYDEVKGQWEEFY